MKHLNLPFSKRNPRQWRLLDIITAAFFAVVLLFFILLFTPLGDSMAASGRQTLLVSTTSDPRQRQRLVTLVESGHHLQPIEYCPADAVAHMPCEDPRRNSQLSREMNFYRERHCPLPEETPLCLIPPPNGYKISVPWPESLHKARCGRRFARLLKLCVLKLQIWHANMPYNKIADRKGHQGWMKREGEYFIFPGGGTMFPGGAGQYIEKLSQYIPLNGGTLRTALDMGCGIQFALERGVPAFVAMLGTRRLPFPASSFDFMHCSRCLIPFTAYNATCFVEVDRLLRPGGYLVISGPPVQWPKQDKEWADLQAVARAFQNEFGLELCDESVPPSDAWYYKSKKCVTRPSSVKGEIALGTIPKWPERLTKVPSRAIVMKNGLDMFEADARRWARRVAYYRDSLNLELKPPSVRNVMDMNAFFGGFAAALASESVWVMNVIPARKPLTLDVVYDRGLIGVYHDWCEPFSTYPRTYDFIHLSGVESLIQRSDSSKSRCSLVDLMVEMDRILRPEGKVLIRDTPEVLDKVARIQYMTKTLNLTEERRSLLQPNLSGECHQTRTKATH
ncbi:hypothetical protein F2Q69_00039393 [Brassica cretica]|uniref:Methyltransferase n=1 Tax=Brassica cretica TaxID=69181 RepID=A0A8S9NBF5_BRACR|nr:hypothetical protein F2Q69_00039393 [Brassica cretica]